jgi:CheY-like chemotaxis protein
MKEIEILVIDDDSDDVQFFQQALNNSDLICTMIAFFDAEAAFGHLEKRADRIDKMPDVIVLDLNLPRIHGHDALATLKANDKFHNIPVLVLSNSKRAADSEKSFMYGAAGYFIKPMRDDDWFPIIQTIFELTEPQRSESIT